MAETFPNCLKRLIDARFKSRREFIRAAQPQASVDGGQGYLSQVLSGKKPPPMNRLPAWADALELTADARQQFFDLAREDVLTRAPDDVKELVASLRAEVTQLRQQNQQAAEQQLLLLAKIDRLKAKIPK